MVVVRQSSVLISPGKEEGCQRDDNEAPAWSLWSLVRYLVVLIMTDISHTRDNLFYLYLQRMKWTRPRGIWWTGQQHRSYTGDRGWWTCFSWKLPSTKRYWHLYQRCQLPNSKLTVYRYLNHVVIKETFWLLKICSKYLIREERESVIIGYFNN